VDQPVTGKENMSIADSYVEDLVNRLRTYAKDDDDEILAIWEEVINVDIASKIAQSRKKELQKFQEWITGSDNCVVCGKECLRLEMYSYQARIMVKVEYTHRYSHLWQNANGACYDCQKKYIDNHTNTCIDCGAPYFQVRNIQLRCESCQTKRNEVLPHNTRARKLGLPANLDYKQWSQTLFHFNQSCAYCGGDYDVIEHFTPLTLGGETSAQNCVPACVRCNSSKSNIDGRIEKVRLAKRLQIPVKRLHEIQKFLESR
jgi:5-methylcytosine-specific restriction endonuclease McrA